MAYRVLYWYPTAQIPWIIPYRRRMHRVLYTKFGHPTGTLGHHWECEKLLPGPW